MIKQRQLTIIDLALAHRLSEEDASRIADPLLYELRSLAMPGGVDPAGIPYRGSEVFRELMEGRPIEELRAAYVAFRRLGCQSGVIDALEFAQGTDEDLPNEFGHKGTR